MTAPTFLRTLLPILALLPLAAAQDLRPLPTLEQATRITATANNQQLTWPALLDALAKHDVVFLGETHVDDTTHRAELAVLEGLLARRQNKVVLSMEMFERDVQPALDDYLQGRCDEATFVTRARAWDNYPTAYKPLIECAKQAGIPVVAANFPAMLRRKLGSGGKAAFDKLTPAERALMPDTIHPASDAYWQRVDRAVRGHMGGGGSGTPEERLYDGQNLWDNAMGDNIAKARAAHPDSLVLHVAGGFHVAYRDGTVAQCKLRSPDSKTVVAQITPVPALHAARPDLAKDEADYLIHAATLARDENEGNYAVQVPAELRYRLSAPSTQKPLPLLIWLPDRATRPEDAFAFWTSVLGEQAAVAVVEQPFPELQDDLATGGRYAFGDGFRADYSRLQHGLERIVEYVTRRLPVDGRQVLIAGTGDGGAAVLWSALYGEWLDIDMLAIDPSDLTRLSMEGLPDRKPATRTLQIAAQHTARERLEKVAADYLKVGTTTAVLALGNDRSELVGLIRKTLSLPTPTAATAEPLLFVLDQDTPRGRQWADMLALRSAQQGKPARVVTASEVPADIAPERVRKLRLGTDGQWPIAKFATGIGLPLAGGPFGGTTVVVLPAGTSDADAAAWAQLEQRRAIKQRSMFANLAIARVDGEPSLTKVFEQLRSKGRSRVLVVPAAFCADAATMQHLRTQIGSAAAGMDLSFLPGFGAELAQ